MSTTFFVLLLLLKISRGEGWTENGRSFTINQENRSDAYLDSHLFFDKCVIRFFFFLKKKLCVRKLWTWPIFYGKARLWDQHDINNQPCLHVTTFKALVYEAIELLLTRKRLINCVQLFVGFHRTPKGKQKDWKRKGEGKCTCKNGSTGLQSNTWQ